MPKKDYAFNKLVEIVKIKYQFVENNRWVRGKMATKFP